MNPPSFTEFQLSAFTRTQLNAFLNAGCLDTKTAEAYACMLANEEQNNKDMQVALSLTRLINSDLTDLQKISQILALFGCVRLEKYGPIPQIHHLLRDFMTKLNIYQDKWGVLNSLIYQTRSDVFDLLFNLKKIKKQMGSKCAVGSQICSNLYYSTFRR